MQNDCANNKIGCFFLNNKLIPVDIIVLGTKVNNILKVYEVIFSIFLKKMVQLFISQ